MASEELNGLTIAIYARFSSDNQRDASIEDQVRVCRAWVEARGGRVREEMLFVDRGMSGSGSDRPSFARLVDLATRPQRQIDVIVAEHTDRLGRDAAELHLLYRGLEHERVRLVTLSGVDTSSSSAHLLFAVESAFATAYLRDLRAKTLRGLEGRVLAGFAAGAPPFGYALKKETDASGKAIGSRPVVDAVQAKIVVRVFRMCVDGYSTEDIAKALNADGVAPPRVYATRRRAGWKDNTIGNFLRNEKYIGIWKYKQKEWRKTPGTNVRRYSKRAESDVMVFERPELAIIDRDLWDAATARRRAVGAHYNPKKRDGASRTVPGRRTPYLFSSLLVCGSCGAKMIIAGGGSASYYRCEGQKKRGTCDNKASIREDLVRRSLLDELRRRLMSSDGITYARKKVAERLGALGREQDGEAKERRARLASVEAQIEKLVDFVATSGGSKSVKERLIVLEREAQNERRALASFDLMKVMPINLPTPEQMMKLVFDLERRLLADVTKGREMLRRIFRNGTIALIPEPGGYYTARSEIFPLVLLTTAPAEGDQGGRDVISRGSAISCAGRI